MILLSGKIVNEKIKEELVSSISSMRVPPTLAIIQIGENPESNIYVGQKEKFGLAIGADVLKVSFSDDASTEEVVKKINTLNKDEKIKGIIVQLPIPKQLNKRIILDAIDFEKDVDGLGTIQSGLLSIKDKKTILPATVRGVISLLAYYEIDLKGKHVVVVGRSDLVGKPLALACLHLNATVTICHTHTNNLKGITKLGDILVVACGVPKKITSEYVRNGQVVIDVGIHRTESGLCGDVDFDSVKDIVSSISPVPGGVGPLTVASLFQNLVDSANSK